MFNGLLLNPAKSDILWTGTCPQVLSVSNLTSQIHIATTISLSKTVKIAGVIIDELFTFDQHVSEVCRVSNYHLRALSHIRRYLDEATANTIATSIISSRLDYCNSLFTGLSDYNFLRLQRIQNRAARIVTNSRGPVSCSALLKQLHWLPVPNRVDYKVALLTFKTLCFQQPAYLSSMLHLYTSGRALRSTSQHLLAVPASKTAFHARAFSVYAPKLWNRLPQALRDTVFNSPPVVPLPSISNPSLPHIPTSPDLSTFKRLLKTFLFDSQPRLLVS